MTAADPAVPSTAIEFTIDPEFASLCPEYTGEDALGLEQSLREHGAREPLVVWSEERVLLDGHRRHALCTAHGIPYAVVEYSFADRQAATNWVIQNQLSRRNLTKEQRDFLVGKRYAAEKKEPAETLRRGETSPRGQTDHAGRTAARVAAAAGVSEKTVRRAAKYAQDIDRIGESCPEAKVEILSGRVKLTQAQVAAVAAVAPRSLADVKRAATAVRRSAKKAPLPRVPGTESKERLLEEVNDLSAGLARVVRLYLESGYPAKDLLALDGIARALNAIKARAAAAAPDGVGQ